MLHLNSEPETGDQDPHHLSNAFRVSDTNKTREPDIELLLAGDPDEFELLVRRESERLFRVIRRFVSDEDEAKSLVQETFLQAFERRQTFRRESRFTTWLYAIGINLARASNRKTSRMTPLSDADMDRLQPAFGTAGDVVSPPVAWNPARMVESSERKRIVRDGIDRLPSDYREVITLRDIEELSTKDVARILGITEGAVRVRLHRARQALHSLLDSYFRD